MKKIFLFLFLTFISTCAFSAEKNYRVVIDAHDAGSTLHLFELQQDNRSVNEIFSETATPSLWEGREHVQNAVAALQTLLDHAEKKLNDFQVSPSAVRLDILGTESLRTLTASQQTALYHALRAGLHSSFVFNQVETLSGKMQGVSTWLAVNFLDNHLQAPSFSILDVGNSSSLIAFSTNDSHYAEDEIALNIQGQQYRVFSKEFSELGLDVIRDIIQQERMKGSCFPIGFPPDGNFNIATCGNLYQHAIAHWNILSKMPAFSDKSFVINHAGYQIYEFLEAEEPDQLAFETRLNYVCTLPWEEMKIEYDFLPEKILAPICANSIFIDQLVYNTLRLDESHIWATDKIHRTSIQWTLGWALIAFGIVTSS